MTTKDMEQKFQEIKNSLNERGIPVPMIRDYKSNKPSVSLTLVFISFNVWLVSIIGKAAGFLGGMNTESAFNMFIACSALYWSRNLNVSKDSASLEKVDKNRSDL